MYELIKQKMIKARKVHRCAWCAGDISVGHFCIYRAYKLKGDFNNDWMHNDCSRDYYQAMTKRIKS